MRFSAEEILETIRMVQDEHLDVRTLTLGVSLLDTADADPAEQRRRIYDKITCTARRLVQVASELEATYGVPIVNRRISVTPVALVAGRPDPEHLLQLARTLDRAAGEVGVDFIGGFGALAHKGMTAVDRALVDVLPQALAGTSRLNAAVSVASTRAGINMEAVLAVARAVRGAAELSAERRGVAAARLVAFCNAVEDNPFMAGAFHGPGEPDVALHVGVSGPGVVLQALRRHPGASLDEVAAVIRGMAFKITRMGELIGREASRRLGVPFGIVDLSLAPTNAMGDSVAEILEEIGVDRCGAPGTTAALALLNDAVKRGGAMATGAAGGLSGAFIPVSEDEGMVAAVRAGALSLPKLEAMTAVCSVGLDMIAIPGDTPVETIAGILADEAAIGMVNRKTTGARLIPVPGARPGEVVEFGGLLGRAPVMDVGTFGCRRLMARTGRIPAPLQGLSN